MIQRLIDDAIIATRANLASELVENEMTKFFTKEFEEAGDPVELYAAPPKIEEERIKIAARIANLVQAEKEIRALDI